MRIHAIEALADGLADVPTIWSPVVSFIMYAIADQIQGTDTLTPAKVFTSLGIITLVTEPASKLLAAVPQIAAALGCFERLQDYMTSESFKDARSSGKQEGEPLPSDPVRAREQGDAARSNVADLPSQANNSIEFVNATVFPAPKAESAALSEVSFSIKSKSVVFALGPIGSGKRQCLRLC